MTLVSTAPWPVTWYAGAPSADPALVDLALSAAADLLWSLSGRFLGVSTYDELLELPGFDCSGPHPPHHYLGHHDRGYECCQIRLPHQAVQSVIKVWIDDVQLSTDEYVVERGHLRRIGACWPRSHACRDPRIHVLYSAGAVFPPSTGLAVAETATEFLKGFMNQACRLPSKTINVARQGVSVEVGATLDYIKAGLTGLPITDAWIRSVNPAGLKAPSTVISPDMVRLRS